MNRPYINPDADEVADQAKHAFAKGTQAIAATQYRLAELAGTGRLSRDDSFSLQDALFEIWQFLYCGTVCAVRDCDTHDSTWDEQDNTYSDGRQVIHQVRIEPEEESDGCWEHNGYLLGDGAINEFPLGTVSCIAPVHAEEW